jgi:hypothetical protein
MMTSPNQDCPNPDSNIPNPDNTVEANKVEDEAKPSLLNPDYISTTNPDSNIPNPNTDTIVEADMVGDVAKPTLPNTGYDSTTNPKSKPSLLNRDYISTTNPDSNIPNPNTDTIVEADMVGDVAKPTLPNTGYDSTTNPKSDIPNPDNIDEKIVVAEAKPSLPNPEDEAKPSLINPDYIPTTNPDSNIPNTDTIVEADMVRELAKASLPNPVYDSTTNPESNIPNPDNIDEKIVVAEEAKPSLPNPEDKAKPSLLNPDYKPSLPNPEHVNPDNDFTNPNNIAETNMVGLEAKTSLPNPGQVSTVNPDSNIPNPDNVAKKNKIEEAKPSQPNPVYDFSRPDPVYNSRIPNPNKSADTNMVGEKAKPSLPNPGNDSKPNPDNNISSKDHPNDDTTNHNIVIDTNIVEEDKPSLSNPTKDTNADQPPISENATTPNPINDTPSPNNIDDTNPSKVSTKNYLTCEEFKTKLFKNVFETKGIKELNKIQVVNLIMKEILLLENDYDTRTTRAYLGSDEFMKQLLKYMYMKRNETEDTFAQTVQEIVHLDESYQKKNLIKLSSDGKPNPGGIKEAIPDMDESPNPKVVPAIPKKVVASKRKEKLERCTLDHKDMSNFEPESNSGYCKEFNRFYGAVCRGGCKSKFVCTKVPGDTKSFKPTITKPMRTCINVRGKCPVAYCDTCFRKIIKAS